MYLIKKAYDDNEADLIDIETMEVTHKTEIELIRMSNSYDIIGLVGYGKKLYGLTPYTFIKFESEEEANRYLEETDDNASEIIELNNNYFIISKSDNIVHVDYAVVTAKETERLYLSKYSNPMYTPYIQSAKLMSKYEAKEKAALMTKRSKKGTFWIAERIPN